MDLVLGPGALYPQEIRIPKTEREAIALFETRFVGKVKLELSRDFVRLFCGKKEMLDGADKIFSLTTYKIKHWESELLTNVLKKIHYRTLQIFDVLEIVSSDDFPEIHLVRFWARNKYGRLMFCGIRRNGNHFFLFVEDTANRIVDPGIGLLKRKMPQHHHHH